MRHSLPFAQDDVIALSLLHAWRHSANVLQDLFDVFRVVSGVRDVRSSVPVIERSTRNGAAAESAIKDGAVDRRRLTSGARAQRLAVDLDRAGVRLTRHLSRRLQDGNCLVLVRDVSVHTECARQHLVRNQTNQLGRTLDRSKVMEIQNQHWRHHRESWHPHNNCKEDGWNRK